MQTPAPPSGNALPEMTGADQDGPSASLRSLITLLLIFHFFALLIAVSSNALPLSALRNKLSDVGPLQVYTDALYMNLAYNFHLTNASEDDIDHFIELELLAADPQTVRLPEAQLWPAIRSERFGQLALNAVPREGQSRLVAALAKGITARLGTPEGTHLLKIYRRTLVPRENAAHPDRALSDPMHEQRLEIAYQANVLVGDGQIDLVEIVPEGERAQVRPQGNR